MEILIEITKDNNTSKLNIKGASKESENAIINGFFNIVRLAKVPQIKPEPTINTLVDAKKVAERVVEQMDKQLNNIVEQKGDKNTNDTPDIERQIQRPRQLPLLGSEHRTTAKVGEVATIVVSDQQQEHWITGIKVDEDGTKRYRCHYWCPCGGKGKRYIPLETKTITCRDCEKELQVETATPEIGDDGVPGRDDFGNYYIARIAI